jgi:hypothetical protein
MENKYYTPNIEEFHVGFEFEFYNSNGHFVFEAGEGWHKAKWGTCPEFRFTDNMQYFIINGLVRVKYLDVRDIESVGVKEEKVDPVSFRPFMSDGNDKIEERKTFIKKHIQICWWESIPYSIVIIDNKEIMYQGSCKNLSKLKQILTDIGVNERLK